MYGDIFTQSYANYVCHTDVTCNSQFPRKIFSHHADFIIIKIGVQTYGKNIYKINIIDIFFMFLLSNDNIIILFSYLLYV